MFFAKMKKNMKKNVEVFKMKLEIMLKEPDNLETHGKLIRVITVCLMIRSRLCCIKQEFKRIIKSISDVPIPYKKRKDKSIYELPYIQEVRLAALERAAREIYERKIVGSVAEAGVYKGDFAKYINWWFYDRKMYLIDTFEGFDDRDIKSDKKRRHAVKFDDWSRTSVDYVLARMQNRENCVIKKGWFPEVMKNTEDIFCFVSLDMDLYEPIYAGLEYFYPRLSGGGYIFVHDCCDGIYKGSRQAVLDFAEKNGIGFVILPDDCGTAVITK